MERERSYQVYCHVGGSNERVALFESTDFDECAKVWEDYERNPMKANHVTRDYLRSWGPGIDGFYVCEVKPDGTMAFLT